MTTASRILGVICLMIALTFLVPILLMNAHINAVARLMGIVFFLPVALGPLGYLYCRSALLGTKFVKGDWLHSLPVLFCYAITADVSLVNPSELISWITSTGAPNARLQFSEYLPYAIVFAYAIWTGWIIWRYRQQAEGNLANFNPSVFTWLLSLQVFNFVVWTLKALSSFTRLSYVPDIANLLLVIFIYVIAVIQWRNPAFFKVDHLSETPLLSAPIEAEQENSSLGGELDPDTRASLYESVKERLETSALYLDSELTLSSLAEATDLSRHQLSEVLNKHLGKNFYEFINSYRINFACERLADNPDRNVLDIAFEAGFSSKSTFNSAFKRFTGKTPRQYRNTTDLAR